MNHDLMQTKLPREENTVDAVTACLMLEHIPQEELCRVFSDVRRVLKPGGYMIVTEMHPWLWEKGGEAQFHTPEGQHIIVSSFRKNLGIYLTEALKAGLKLVAIEEVPMDSITGKKDKRCNNFLNFLMLLWYIVKKP